jgi:hypothetical protein
VLPKRCPKHVFETMWAAPNARIPTQVERDSAVGPIRYVGAVRPLAMDHRGLGLPQICLRDVQLILGNTPFFHLQQHS